MIVPSDWRRQGEELTAQSMPATAGPPPEAPKAASSAGPSASSDIRYVAAQRPAARVADCMSLCPAPCNSHTMVIVKIDDQLFTLTQGERGYTERERISSTVNIGLIAWG